MSTGLIINGPNSPNFHEYEMWKAAEKTGVFHEKTVDSKEEVRKRKREWLWISIGLIAVAVLVYFLVDWPAGKQVEEHSRSVYINEDGIRFYQHLDETKDDVFKYLHSLGVVPVHNEALSDQTKTVYEIRGGVFGKEQTAYLTFGQYGKSKKFRLQSYTESITANAWPEEKSGLEATVNKAYEQLVLAIGGGPGYQTGFSEGEQVLSSQGFKQAAWDLEKAKIDFTVEYHEGQSFVAAVEYKSKTYEP